MEANFYFLSGAAWVTTDRILISGFTDFWSIGDLSDIQKFEDG